MLACFGGLLSRLTLHVAFGVLLCFNVCVELLLIMLVYMCFNGLLRLDLFVRLDCLICLGLLDWCLLWRCLWVSWFASVKLLLLLV